MSAHIFCKDFFVCVGDHSINCLKDSIILWTSICESKLLAKTKQMRYTTAEAETRHHYGAAGIWPHAMETLSKYNWLLVEPMIEPCSHNQKMWMDWLVGMKITQMEFVFAEIVRKLRYMRVKYDKISMKVAARIAYQESRNGNLERERVMRFVREYSERHKKKEWWLRKRTVIDWQGYRWWRGVRACGFEREREKCNRSWVDFDQASTETTLDKFIDNPLFTYCLEPGRTGIRRLIAFPTACTRLSKIPAKILEGFKVGMVESEPPRKVATFVVFL